MRQETGDSSNEDSLNDPDLALIAKRFRNLFRPRKGNNRNKSSKVAE
jgi:hypothetical protein